MRRLAVGIQIGIHIEELTERQLTGNTLQVHSRSVVRADLQIRHVERAIASVSILSDEVLKFFDWAFKNGKKDAVDLDYVPLPDALTKQIRERVWTQIK